MGTTELQGDHSISPGVDLRDEDERASHFLEERKKVIEGLSRIQLDDLLGVVEEAFRIGPILLAEEKLHSPEFPPLSEELPYRSRERGPVFYSAATNSNYKRKPREPLLWLHGDEEGEDSEKTSLGEDEVVLDERKGLNARYTEVYLDDERKREFEELLERNHIIIEGSVGDLRPYQISSVLEAVSASLGFTDPETIIGLLQMAGVTAHLATQEMVPPGKLGMLLAKVAVKEAIKTSTDTNDAIMILRSQANELSRILRKRPELQELGFIPQIIDEELQEWMHQHGSSVYELFSPRDPMLFNCSLENGYVVLTLKNTELIRMKIPKYVENMEQCLTTVNRVIEELLPRVHFSEEDLAIERIDGREYVVLISPPLILAEVPSGVNLGGKSLLRKELVTGRNLSLRDIELGINIFNRTPILTLAKLPGAIDILPMPFDLDKAPVNQVQERFFETLNRKFPEVQNIAIILEDLAMSFRAVSQTTHPIVDAGEFPFWDFLEGDIATVLERRQGGNYDTHLGWKNFLEIYLPDSSHKERIIGIVNENSNLLQNEKFFHIFLHHILAPWIQRQIEK